MNKQIQEIYDGVLGIVSEAKSLLDETHMPDTVAMKNEVEKLCKVINDLPLQERVAYADDLGVLFAELSSLEEKLKEKRHEVGAMLSDVPVHKAASKAYAKVETSDKQSKNRKVEE